MDGILVVDKPKGLTSHDIVLFVRKRFGEKKVGHTGILDPMATGVLILVLGRCTRMANTFIEQDKEYQAILRLGIQTNTQDREGKIISQQDLGDLSVQKVREAFSMFAGEMDQIPPMVSSRRFQGKRLYELARNGIEVERPPKKIFIRELTIDWIKLPFVSFRLACSKGTYVRTISHDIGNILGVGGSLFALQRTRSGSFHLNQAVSWPELNSLSRDEFKTRVLSSSWIETASKPACKKEAANVLSA